MRDTGTLIWVAAYFLIRKCRVNQGGIGPRSTADSLVHSGFVIADISDSGLTWHEIDCAIDTVSVSRTFWIHTNGTHTETEQCQSTLNTSLS